MSESSSESRGLLAAVRMSLGQLPPPPASSRSLLRPAGETVRAIRHDGARVYLDPRAEAPAPGPGEALLRPLRIAIGPADSIPANGHTRADPSAAGKPFTIGHEFVAVVERLHDSAERDIRKRWEGRRIVGSPIIVCTKCDMCR